MDDIIDEYLKTKNCRGCSNMCPLNDPGCGRSKIFIDDAIRKFDGGDNGVRK
ncbi:MAG: hypothetical protein HFJ45_01450 [Clostridia bacterium]|nr:hypothetical protein [Clostridia bacterium]